MYQITVWVDESDQYENRFRETDNGDGTITHTKERGTIYVVGTPQDAAHFNNLEYEVRLLLPRARTPRTSIIWRAAYMTRTRLSGC